MLVWTTTTLNLFCSTLEIRNILCLESIVFVASTFHVFWEAANGWIRWLSRLAVLFIMVPIQNYYYKKPFFIVVNFLILVINSDGGGPPRDIC